MYASFFGLRELPFNNTPDPRFFYPTRDHEEALASLVYAVQERKGFVLLTGEVGAGKTLVSRMMLRHFGTGIAFATINHALGSGGDLLESICTEFELPFEPQTTHTQLVRLLHDFLLARFAQDTPVVLVLDEAQTLPIDAFEQVRMIGNLEADDAKLLQVAIFGQPELQNMFMSPALRQLKQRVFRSFHLPALNREDTEKYVHHRLSVAGAPKPNLFDADAIALIHDYSRGLPRIINTLCDNAMLSAYSVGQREMGGALIESVVKQMMAFGNPASEELAAGRGVSAPAPERFAKSVHPPGASHGDTSGRFEMPPPLSGQHTSPAPRTLLDAGYARQDLTNPYPASPTPEPMCDHSAIVAVRNEMGGLARDLKYQIDHANGRLANVESRIAHDASQLSDVRAAYDGLKRLVAQAESLVQRGKGAGTQLAGREARVQELAAKMRRVVDDVRQIFSGLKRAAANAQNAERGAQQVYEKLYALTERSKRVAGRLSHLSTRLTHEVATEPSHPSRIIKEASTPVVGPEPLPNPDDRNGPRLERFQKILLSSRESLAQLRSLVRNEPTDPGGQDEHGDASTVAPSYNSLPGTPDATDHELPTQRLADEVNSLLTLVKSRTPAGNARGALPHTAG